MKKRNYEKLTVPIGFRELAHFFIQDKGKPETRIEVYWYEVLEDGYSEFRFPVEKGEIISANAFVQDDYEELRWYSGIDPLASWFMRTQVKMRDKYEIKTEPYDD